MSPSIGYLIGGLVVGGAVGSIAAWLITKKKYEKIIDNKIQEMSDEVAKVDPFAPKPKKKESEEIKIDDTEKVENKAVSYDDISDLVRTSKSEAKTRTDYTKAYDDSNDVVAAEKTNMFDILKEAKEVDLDDEDEAEVTFHSKEDLHTDPYVISEDEAGNIPDEYESETLFYYVPNDALVDEYDDEIDEPGKLVGQTLETSGFKENKDRHLYVRNPRLSVIYDVQKVFHEWEGKEGGV